MQAPLDPTAVQLTPLLVAAIAFAGSILGAVVGGFMTVVTARRKLRSERAFDRRLQWHEDMHRALHVVIARVKELEQLRLLGQFPDYDASGVYEAMTKVEALKREMPLFAAPRVIDHVEAMTNPATMMPPFTQEELNTDPVKLGVMFNKWGNMMLLADAAVLHDCRQQLGMEPLYDMKIWRRDGGWLSMPPVLSRWQRFVRLITKQRTWPLRRVAAQLPNAPPADPLAAPAGQQPT